MPSTYMIESTEEFDASLDMLRDATGRTERMDVLRDALELYDLIVKELRQGKRLWIGDSRDGAAEVALPQLVRAREWRGLRVIEGG